MHSTAFALLASVLLLLGDATLSLQLGFLFPCRSTAHGHTRVDAGRGPVDVTQRIRFPGDGHSALPPLPFRKSCTSSHATFCRICSELVTCGDGGHAHPQMPRKRQLVFQRRGPVSLPTPPSPHACAQDTSVTFLHAFTSVGYCLLCFYLLQNLRFYVSAYLFSLPEIHWGRGVRWVVACCPCTMGG